MLGPHGRADTGRGVGERSPRADRNVRDDRGEGPPPTGSGGVAPGRDVPQHQARLDGCNDARTGVPVGMPTGAMCVQRFDDSLNSAIHITYRISLRSSSMPEPRDPLLKVLTDFAYSLGRTGFAMRFGGSSGGGPPRRGTEPPPKQLRRVDRGCAKTGLRPALGNDPSEGSPTETLLRLLLPLNDQV